MAVASEQNLIPLEDVRATAEMARLHVSNDEELAKMAGELSRILQFAQALSEVDVQGVPPTTHAVPMDCPLREDVVGEHLDIEGALKNAPATEATFFTVPTIIGAGGVGGEVEG